MQSEASQHFSYLLKGRERYSEYSKQPLETAEGIAVIYVQTSGLTGASEHNCKLSIVTVQVKSRKGCKIVHTYAFLNHGTASFCTVGLMNKLNLSGRKSSILLRTMGQEKIVESYIVSDLEVVDWTVTITVSYLIHQKSIPVHRGNIPRQKDL